MTLRRSPTLVLLVQILIIELHSHEGTATILQSVTGSSDFLRLLSESSFFVQI